MTDSIKTSDKQFTKSESSKEKPNNKLFSEGEEYAEDRYTVEDEEIIFIKGTPFNLRKKDGKRVILIGVELASGKVFDDIESAKDYIKEKPWELIVTTACIMAGDMVGLTNRLREKAKREGGEEAEEIREE